MAQRRFRIIQSTNRLIQSISADARNVPKETAMIPTVVICI